MEATAKPAGRACPWCDDAGWRWNGFEWYAADTVTRKLHVCTTAEAVADRSEREARATHGGLRRAFAKLLRQRHGRGQWCRLRSLLEFRIRQG
jgi:hypothetical protein